MGRVLARHRPLVAIVAAGALLRLAAMVAYTPALFFSDSWAYLRMAYDSALVGMAVDRPSGYGVFIEAVSLPGRSLTAIVAVQHLLGLAVGVLAYALLLRLRAPLGAALAVAAIVVLDAFLIALEHHVLPSALFALLLLAAAALTLTRPHAPAALAASGVLLAAAVTVRTSAIFALPVWGLFVLLRHRRPGGVALAAAAALLPLLAYGAVQHAVDGKFGLNQSSGWFLYGRVAEIADCTRMDVAPASRGLCEPADRPHRGAAFYVWDPRSPASRTFGPIDGPRHAEADAALRTFARSTIRARPGAYARMVGADLLRYFTPGARSLGRSDSAITLPTAPQDAEQIQRDQLARLFPGTEQEVRAPAGALHAYGKVVHLPRWLLGAAALLALATAAAWLVPRARPRVLGTGDGLLLCGMALAIVAGSAATSEFIIRYLVPVAPLLLCGGVLLATALVRNRAATAAEVSGEAGTRPRGPARFRRPPGGGRRSGTGSSRDRAPAPAGR